METRIRKCANPKCPTIIPTTERPNKKYCSESCKNSAHNEYNRKSKFSWEKVIEKYHIESNNELIALLESERNH